MLRNKTKAPEFTLPDENGVLRSLAELRDHRCLLILFGRFAGCPTTQRDLVSYANIAGRLKLLETQAIVITTDTPERLKAFREQWEIPFPMLSDRDFAVSAEYGVYLSDEVEEGVQPHGEPALHLLDVDGEIAYSQIMSGPKGIAHPAEIALMLLYMSHNGGKYW